MSINSLCNSAAARRPDMGVAGKTPRDLRQIAQAARVMPAPATEAPAGPRRPQEVIGATARAPAGPAAPTTRAGTPGSSGNGTDAGSSVSAVDTAYNVLFGYIPTEIVTVYVALGAALASAAATSQTKQTIFLAFCVATPVVVWLVYASKLKSSGKDLPLRYGTWPVWEMFAATVAFGAWSSALPANPLATSTLEMAVSGVLVLVTSTVLGLMAPIFQRPLGS